MKHVFSLFFIIPTLIFSSEGNIDSVEAPLRGFQKFEVLPIIGLDENDQNVIYETIIASFKELGQVTVLESGSPREGVLDSTRIKPMCLFSIRDDAVSLNVFTEVEISANKHKTTCPIWEKKVYVLHKDENGQTGTLSIASSTEKVIKKFSEDCVKANQLDSKQQSFQIRIHKGL
jgi:hypothetical protein